MANIVRDAAIIQAGMGHITEAYADSQGLSDKFAHLVTFAINLPTTIEGDEGYWAFALNLVSLDTFRKGAEYLDIKLIDSFIRVLEDVRAIKLEIKKDEK